MDAKIILTVAEAEKDHDKWLATRNKGIGGSDASIIMGYNPYRSKLSLWMEKTGRQEPEDLSDNQAVQWGIRHEPTIAKWFAEETGKKLRKCGTMQNVKHPWLLANVDRLVEGEEAGVEIKTAGVKQYPQWAEEELPDAYYCQVQHYMLVTGLKKWYVAVLLAGNEARIREVPRNEAFIAEMFQKEAAFWTLVEHYIMPEVDGLESTKDALNELYPKAVKESVLELETTETIEEIFRDYASYKKSIAELEILKAECENKIKKLMGDNERCKVGEHKASWINMPGKKSIDLKALELNNPKIYKKYMKEGKPFRKFTMK